MLENLSLWWQTAEVLITGHIVEMAAGIWEVKWESQPAWLAGFSSGQVDCSDIDTDLQKISF